ncbi:hypothetical protein C3B55_00246 [Candidatus Pseudomonas adelgestsugas]|uniref:Uncharacterized protein n=1 Tax=Candidatus Pseudomonas adelgestsugas TaxID=1302376 RepID=A0ABX5R850_9PSED|nr:hypothetical protein C3B55_00246 [Candidatus Pseudomonas adelgestsugas]
MVRLSKLLLGKPYSMFVIDHFKAIIRQLSGSSYACWLMVLIFQSLTKPQ